ncbi:hypothetical protein L596_001691 [Steinernema carpocapsae]|uniref:Uncharacterized protein n=1 Tax=Steinernema carpocapsae TaxID=34508 RepID=A0A4U8UM96_STECR|nr:hypothetical protein L596_001691 [Steinernema carpocapsae]
MHRLKVLGTGLFFVFILTALVLKRAAQKSDHFPAKLGSGSSENQIENILEKVFKDDHKNDENAGRFRRHSPQKQALNASPESPQIVAQKSVFDVTKPRVDTKAPQNEFLEEEQLLVVSDIVTTAASGQSPVASENVIKSGSGAEVTGSDETSSSESQGSTSSGEIFDDSTSAGGQSLTGSGIEGSGTEGSGFEHPSEHEGSGFDSSGHEGRRDQEAFELDYSGQHVTSDAALTSGEAFEGNGSSGEGSGQVDVEDSSGSGDVSGIFYVVDVEENTPVVVQSKPSEALPFVEDVEATHEGHEKESIPGDIQVHSPTPTSGSNLPGNRNLDTTPAVTVGDHESTSSTATSDAGQGEATFASATSSSPPDVTTHVTARFGASTATENAVAGSDGHTPSDSPVATAGESEILDDDSLSATSVTLPSSPSDTTQAVTIAALEEERVEDGETVATELEFASATPPSPSQAATIPAMVGLTGHTPRIEVTEESRILDSENQESPTIVDSTSPPERRGDPTTLPASTFVTLPRYTRNVDWDTTQAVTLVADESTSTPHANEAEQEQATSTSSSPEATTLSSTAGLNAITTSGNAMAKSAEHSIETAGGGEIPDSKNQEFVDFSSFTEAQDEHTKAPASTTMTLPCSTVAATFNPPGNVDLDTTQAVTVGAQDPTSARVSSTSSSRPDVSTAPNMALFEVSEAQTYGNEFTTSPTNDDGHYVTILFRESHVDVKTTQADVVELGETNAHPETSTSSVTLPSSVPSSDPSTASHVSSSTTHRSVRPSRGDRSIEDRGGPFGTAKHGQADPAESSDPLLQVIETDASRKTPVLNNVMEDSDYPRYESNFAGFGSYSNGNRKDDSVHHVDLRVQHTTVLSVIASNDRLAVTTPAAAVIPKSREQYGKSGEWISVGEGGTVSSNTPKVIASEWGEFAKEIEEDLSYEAFKDRKQPRVASGPDIFMVSDVASPEPIIVDSSEFKDALASSNQVEVMHPWQNSLESYSSEGGFEHRGQSNEAVYWPASQINHKEMDGSMVLSSAAAPSEQVYVVYLKVADPPTEQLIAVEQVTQKSTTTTTLPSPTEWSKSLYPYFDYSKAKVLPTDPEDYEDWTFGFAVGGHNTLYQPSKLVLSSAFHLSYGLPLIAVSLFVVFMI